MKGMSRLSAITREVMGITSRAARTDSSPSLETHTSGLLIKLPLLHGCRGVSLLTMCVCYPR